MIHQLTLPGIDMRPRCPLCGQPALLGQWSPFAKGACCRACAEREPFPLESLAFDGQDWQIVPGLPNALYERRITGEERLRAATKKREYSAGSSYPSPIVRQISIPVCSTCGKVHDHWHISDYAGQCQRCEDISTVEGLLRMRGTILQGDDETVLDRLYRTHRGLFDRGVLPDAWFMMRVR